MQADRRTVLTGGVLAAGALAARVEAQPVEPGSPRRRERLDRGWRFALGHAQDPARDFGFGANQRLFAKAGETDDSPGPARAGFDDAQWRPVQLPHDWAVTLPFAPPPLPLDPKAGDDPRAAHGYKPLGREFPDTSVGWYRRVFRLQPADRGRRIALEFDGVFRDARVFVNGYHVVRHGDGYAPFRVDVTDMVDLAGDNVLAVRVDASEGEGWFYEGAGIYRNVWLTATDPVHATWGGVFARSTLSPDLARAEVRVSTEIAAERDGTPARGEVTARLLDAAGRPAAEPVRRAFDAPAWGAAAVEQVLSVARPALWSPDQPYLYSLVVELRVDGRLVDRVETPFGVREARFDPDRGFLLNGAPLKLKGTCNHGDHAGVGAALPDRLHAFRIERLKAMGSNAYRAAHNPPAPELLDACDRLGMLVVDETRRMSSDPESVALLQTMIRRDRNRPSVIAWSIGNEEPQQSSERGARVAASMKRAVLALDDTRPITEALDNGWGEGVTPVLDVLGFNYRTDKIGDFHTRFPKLPVMGTETASTVTTRGVYVRDAKRQWTTAYDTEAPWWATTAEGWWPYVAERPYIAGGFVWTGFDYRGEPTPFGKWPSVSSYFGVLDSCGFPKDEFFYYKAWWDDAPLLHLFPHWTWPGREGQPVPVWVYSNLDRVELLLNGRSLGVREVARNSHVNWSVPYAPGVIEARGWKGDRLLLRARRETAGPAVRVVLTPDRPRLAADGRDVAVVSAAITDAAGRPAPDSDALLRFEVSGPGRLIGVGNGDPTSHEPDQADARRAFKGLCMALVQSTGEPGVIAIKASADLGSAELRLPTV